MATHLRSLSFSLRFGLLLVVLIGSSSCLRTTTIYSLRELESFTTKKLTEEERQNLIIPYQVDNSMAHYAREVTRHLRSDYDKAVSLVNNIIDTTKLNIQYQNEETKTAVRVFREGQANCLSYTSLFVGLARAIGMNAVFVDVTAVQSLSNEGSVMVHSGHICAGIFYSNSFILIDFAPDPRKKYVRYRIIDDVEAIANFYNNLGYETAKSVTPEQLAQDGDKDLAYYLMAIKLKPDFAKAYNNLGVAYAHRHNLELAERYYRQAITQDRTLAAAYGNLATLYYRRSNYSKAIDYYTKAVKFSNNDYYYHYQLGMTYKGLKNYLEAEKSFRKAIRSKSDYAEAYSGLAVILNLLGRTDEAQTVLHKAKAIAAKQTVELEAAEPDFLDPDSEAEFDDFEVEE